MELELQFEKFRREKQDNLFRCFVAPGNFPFGMTQKIMFHSPSNRIFPKRFVNGKQPMYRTWTIVILPRLRDNSQW